MPGEIFTAPEVIMSYSAEGLDRLSNNLQACIRKHVCRGKWRDEIRPVLLNSWEAYYMDFDGADILYTPDIINSITYEYVSELFESTFKEEYYAVSIVMPHGKDE
jgi:alpha-galactosidase